MNELDRAVGLCAQCRHCQRAGNTRGSIFFRCGRAAVDSAYARYPRLPVVQCHGFEPLRQPDVRPPQ